MSLKLQGRTGASLVIGIVVVAIALAVVPNMFAPPRTLPPVHGQRVEGGIAYADAPIADVLADIELYSALRVQASPEVTARRFSGTLNFSGTGEQIAQRLAKQAGLGLKQSGSHLMLEMKIDSAR